jgi:CRP-like cAMP-binding protein
MVMKARGATSGSSALAEELGRVDLFADLPKKQRQVIADLCREQRFAPGDVLVTQGDESGRFFLIAEGIVDVVIGTRTVNSLGPGQFFGEIALIDGEPRTASIVATTAVRAYSLASFSLRPLLKQEPLLTYRLLLKVCSRLRGAQANLS